MGNLSKSVRINAPFLQRYLRGKLSVRKNKHINKTKFKQKIL